MKQLIVGLVLGMMLMGTAAFAIHRSGHTTIFPEGSQLDRWQRDDDADKARDYDRQRWQRGFGAQPC